MEKCHNLGCPGEYQEERKLHAVRQGVEVIVIDHVPMLVCDFCGDTLLTGETVRRLEELREHRPQPSRMIPLYEYTEADGERVGSEVERAHAAAD